MGEDEGSQREHELFIEMVLLSFTLSLIATPLQAEILLVLGLGAFALVMVLPRLSQAILSSLLALERKRANRLPLQMCVIAVLATPLLLIRVEVVRALVLATYMTVTMIEQMIVLARASSLPRERRSVVFGTLSALSYAGNTAGTLVALVVYEPSVTAIVSIATALRIVLVLIRALHSQVSCDFVRIDRRVVEVSVSLSRVLALTLLVSFSGALFSCASLKLLTMLHGDIRAFCALYSLYSLLAIFVSPAYGALVRRLGPDLSLAVALAVRTASMLLVTFSDDVLVVSCAWAFPSWPMLTIALQEEVCAKVRRGQEPVAQFVLSVSQNFSTALGFLALVLINAHSDMGGSLSSASILTAASPLVFLRYRRRQRI